MIKKICILKKIPYGDVREETAAPRRRY